MNDLDFQLFDAVRANDPVLIESLIDSGADVNATAEAGLTPMLVLASLGTASAECARILIEGGADIGIHHGSVGSMLHMAASVGNTGVIRALIDAGACIDSRNKDKETPLHLAARHGHAEMAKALIELGSNLNARNMAGRTPLHVSVMAKLYGKTPICEDLLDLGAELEARDNDGKTPLSFAVSFHCDSAADRLLARGADFETRDRAGLSPLELAIDGANRDFCLKLVELGARLNPENPSMLEGAPTGMGEAGAHDPAYRPLSRVKPSQQSIGHVLIAYGADPEFGPVDLRNLTPLRAAVMDGLLPRLIHLLDNRHVSKHPSNPLDDLESLRALAIDHQRLEVIGLLDARLARQAIDDALHKATPRHPQT